MILWNSLSSSYRAEDVVHASISTHWHSMTFHIHSLFCITQSTSSMFVLEYIQNHQRHGGLYVCLILPLVHTGFSVHVLFHVKVLDYTATVQLQWKTFTTNFFLCECYRGAVLLSHFLALIFLLLLKVKYESFLKGKPLQTSLALNSI